MAKTLKQTEERVAEVKRRAEEAVSDVKRQAVVELQKAVRAAEEKANEAVASAHGKMEKAVLEARRQATEDTLAMSNHQSDSSEVGHILHLFHSIDSAIDAVYFSRKLRCSTLEVALAVRCLWRKLPVYFDDSPNLRKAAKFVLLSLCADVVSI